MNTSYYYSSKIMYINAKLIRISASYPKHVVYIQKSKVYKPLCPEWDLVNQYKTKKISDKEYTFLYYKHTLDYLDPEKVYNDLGDDSILLCWEKPGLFCHRHIVSNWFKQILGIDVKEL